MFSTVISIVFAVGFSPVVKAIHSKGDLIAEGELGYKAVIECIETGWKAIASDLTAKGGHAEGAEKTEELCIYFRVRAITLLNTKFHVLMLYTCNRGKRREVKNA